MYTLFLQRVGRKHRLDSLQSLNLHYFGMLQQSFENEKFF